jgi:hypothetical protein
MVFKKNSDNFLIFRQCSECDKESSGSDFEAVDTEAPRRLRHNKEAEKLITPLTPRVSSSDSNQAHVKIFVMFSMIYSHPGIVDLNLMLLWHWWPDFNSRAVFIL